MPNWTDDEGNNWFNRTECKRCLKVFELKDGEIPVHECIGGRFCSKSSYGEYHLPVYVGPSQSKK